MKKTIETERDMIDFGKAFAKTLCPPKTIELIGDVGAGKTTLVKGLAKGFGIDEEITSPSFTINKKYFGNGVTLSHYDFYRLNDAGIMRDELTDFDDKTVVVIEWAEAVADVLPKDRTKIVIALNPDGTRAVSVQNRGATSRA
ncbi:MAG: tRNA (adenosine(37)-N6)-threonylcarbamoyltransferase complex ATPase subunit type 1 TsaE [Candidatus Nomurabacteria bacterium]|jgi:tRNA threonylcarbamoyladenosine biosynthesis protein TsaE|nr:tRNA (adenosine(37)-N6)-threonylcarbamoyltransferase complex ATPase subunit type 1 TsaE [Candidatus Nomurabacteria bacterium]